MTVGRAVLILPVAMFCGAVVLVRDRGEEPRDRFEQAELLGRNGQWSEAVQLYSILADEEPGSRLSCKATWEAASISYSVIGDTEKTVTLLHNLLESCQGDDLFGKAMLMLADICEFDLRDLDRAVQLRRQYVQLGPDHEKFHLTLFKIGDVLFKQGKFAEARESFDYLLTLKPEESLASQVRLRIGTILQLSREYDRSIEYFEAVANQSPSSEFRFQARLGMIESYEFLDQLPKALKVANQIQDDECTADQRNDIVMRLNRKILTSGIQ